jgi:transcriptional regulator with XRE-family HTH domain
MATFGQILEGLRRQASLTQRQLADRAGVTQRCVSFWEADRRHPTPAAAERLSAALGVSGAAFAVADPQATRGRPGRPRQTPAWAAAEDELVRTRPPAEVAERTGRRLKAVYERRQVLRVPDGRANGGRRAV